MLISNIFSFYYHNFLHKDKSHLLLSANYLNLDQSKILQFGNVLTPYGKIPSVNDLDQDLFQKVCGKRRKAGNFLPVDEITYYTFPK